MKPGKLSHGFCYDPAVFQHLITAARGPEQMASRQRWLFLEAAHVVGQTRFGPHLQVHIYMLALALREGKVTEAVGQVFRLALVPLGHLLGRLPLGNSGRADVNAFQAMQPSQEVRETIEAAL